MPRYSEEIKKEAVERVANGESANSVAKDYGANTYSVLKWCRERGVESRYAQLRRPDEELLKTIKSLGVARVKDIKEALGYKTSLKRRLRRLLYEGKLNMKRIPGTQHTSLKSFRGYIGCDLYYIDEKDFEEWLQNQARSLPKHLKKPFQYLLKSVGVELPAKKTKRRYVGLDEEIYKQVKIQAKKSGLTIPNYITERLKN